MYSIYIKIFFDKLFAIVLIVLFFPLLIFTTILLFITQGSPVIFTQIRTGQKFERFKLYKFRTLVPTLKNELSMDNRKFTFFGKFMRKSGFDELPQLFNIIKGEISFIGPRPLPIAYEENYNNIQKNRFLVKPGITGWAQVHGKNDITWDRRFELDQWYVSNVSFYLDIKICLMTLFQTFISIFIFNKKHLEMPVFEDSKI